MVTVLTLQMAEVAQSSGVLSAIKLTAWNQTWAQVEDAQPEAPFSHQKSTNIVCDYEERILRSMSTVCL